MNALVLAAVLAAPAQCPGGRCGPTELNFSVRSGYAAPPARYAPAPAYYAPAFEPRRQRQFYFEDTRRGILPWRYSQRRYYFYER